MTVFTRRHVLYEYEYASVSLLSGAYHEATGRRWPAGDQSVPPGITLTRSRPAPTLADLVRATEKPLARQCKPAAVAGPGDCLHVPGAPLSRACALAASSIGGTAALFSGCLDTPETNAVLLVLTGPAEDCPGWASAVGSRLPVPESAADLAQLLYSLAISQDLQVNNAEVQTQPVRAAAGLAWRLSPLPGPLCGPHEVLAQVLVRQPCPNPFNEVIVGVPLWIRRVIPPVG